MIKNAKDKPLNEQSASLPNLGGVLSTWSQKITIQKLEKTVVNGFAVEQYTKELSFIGVFQPYGDQSLDITPERQTTLRPSQLHSTTDLDLQLSDIVFVKGTQYRVINKGQYADYGYFSYSLIEDYSGNGPYKKESEA